MRGKRSKQYRKLMGQFSMTFGFREPYQTLVDAGMVQDACRFKMDLAAALQRTVHGQVKPMITQCEIRRLYSQKSEPFGHEAIELAKTFERRRCGHHPEEYPEPLPAIECLNSVVDPKQTGQNKHRYVIACQDQDVRRMLREIRGVPLIYIKRSVMILEPMADESMQQRVREEKLKFRSGLKNTLGKRKREEGQGDSVDGSDDEKVNSKAREGKTETQDGEKKQKRKGKGPKGPNPLSVRKAKKKSGEQEKPQDKPKDKDESTQAPAKRKRRRRNKAKSEGDDGGDAGQAAATADAGEEET